jgi:CHAT domain-containing protein
VWPWLIRRYAISQTPSASAWLAVRQAAADGPARRALMAWGDPRFAGVKTSPATEGARRQLFSDKIGKARGSSASETPASVVVSYADIPPLPETRDEVLAIAAAVGGDPDVDVLLGEHATRASVLAASTSGELARRRIVIFATHGLMAGDLPNLSQPALAMSATADADRNPLAPLLLLEDVLSLKLNADWVVLSACNTAASDGRAEEALSGLARGFFYAGARSLLVTYWAVETESAKLLSTGMFAHYSANLHASKAQSLQQSILQLLRQPAYAHPAFWAAYALVGDDSR